MALHEVAPDNDMTVLYIRESRVDVLFLLIRLGRRENAVQISRVCFVLPVVLESVHVGLGSGAPLWIYCRRHVPNICRPMGLFGAGQPSADQLLS